MLVDQAARFLCGAATSMIAGWTLLACAPSSVDSSVKDARVRGRPVDAGSPKDAENAEDPPEVDASTEAREEDAAAPLDASVPPLTSRQSLVIHALWGLVEPSEDPFADRPADAGCKTSGVMAELLAEEPVFSVDTGFCNYVTVTQPLLRDVAAGDSLKVRLWHFELTAPLPASAHAAVVVDDVHLLDEQIAIPGAGGLLTRELVAPHAIAAGAAVYFHLHNHGANSWALVEVSTGPCNKAACP